MALHSLGRDIEAAANIKNVETLSEPWVPSGLGYAYAWLGDRDRAFASFERAINEHDLLVAFGLVSDPVLRSLHDDPRWKPLLRKMNLPVE